MNVRVIRSELRATYSVASVIWFVNAAHRASYTILPIIVCHLSDGFYFMCSHKIDILFIGTNYHNIIESFRSESVVDGTNWSDSAITAMHSPYPLCGIMTLYDNGFLQFFVFSLSLEMITMNENKAYTQKGILRGTQLRIELMWGENPTCNSFPSTITTIAFQVLFTMLTMPYPIGMHRNVHVYWPYGCNGPWN